MKELLWEPLLDILMQGLQFFYDFVGDYGIAIVLLTVVIRVLMIPLTIKQTRSMHEMQRIQPKIKEIQKKHKDDKQKQQEELMKFYQENKVNPFGGCLPLLLQMPILFALFSVLRNDLVEAIAALPEAQQEAARAFWIILPDLTTTPGQVFTGEGLIAAIPYLVFVALFAVSTWLPQKMLSRDPQQNRTGLIMSGMMLFFGWSVPAGVLVYWVTSSVWQIGQQAITLRFMAQEEGA